MKEITQQQKRKINRIAKLMDEGPLAITEHLFEVEERIDEALLSFEEKLESLKNTFSPDLMSVLEQVRGKDGDTPSDEKLVSLIKPLIPKIENGKDYVLSEQDKNEIATLAIMDIEVPIVDKVIERIETIREIEIPTVTNNTVEVAKHESAEEIVEKINTLDEDGPKIDASHISNLPVLKETIIRDTSGVNRNPGGGMVEVYNQFGKIGSSQRIRFINATVTVDNDGAVKVTTNSSGGGLTPLTLLSGAVNGSNSNFQFSGVPTYVVIDGLFWERTTVNGADVWTDSGGGVIKVVIGAPNLDIRAYA